MRQKVSHVLIVCLCLSEAIASGIGLCNGSTSKMKLNSTYDVSVEDKCVLCDNGDYAKCGKGGDYDEFFQTEGRQISSHIYVQNNISKNSLCYFCISHYIASLNEFVLNDTVILRYNNKIKIGRWETKIENREKKRYTVKIKSGMSFYDIYLFIP